VCFGRYDRGQTDRQTNTHTYSLQYLATARAGEVKNVLGGCDINYV